MGKGYFEGMLLLCALVVLSILFTNSESHYNKVVSGVTDVLIPSIIFAFALYWLVVEEYEGKYRGVFVGLCIYGLAWTVANFLWLLYEFEIVSVADLFYMSADITLIAVCLLGLRICVPRLVRPAPLTLLGLGSVALISLYLWLVPFSWHENLNLVENIMLSGYSILDLIIFIPALILGYKGISGQKNFGWAVFAAGYLIIFGADIVYAMEEEYGTMGVIADVFWNLGLLVFTYAMKMFMDESNREPSSQHG